MIFVLRRSSSGAQIHFESNGSVVSNRTSRSLCHCHICHHWFRIVFRRVSSHVFLCKSNRLVRRSVCINMTMIGNASIWLVILAVNSRFASPDQPKETDLIELNICLVDKAKRRMIECMKEKKQSCQDDSTRSYSLGIIKKMRQSRICSHEKEKKNKTKSILIFNLIKWENLIRHRRD